MSFFIEMHGVSSWQNSTLLVLVGEDTSIDTGYWLLELYAGINEIIIFNVFV